jgi:hypothetical protein
MRYILLIFSILILLGACRVTRPASSSSIIEGIEVEVWASSDCVQPGETVKLRTTATNRGSRTFKVEFADKPVLDLVVKTSGKLTRWSNRKPFTPEMTGLELKPGESKTIEMNWQVQSTDSLLVNADFAYDSRAGVAPSLLVQVQHCVGPLGP